MNAKWDKYAMDLLFRYALAPQEKAVLMYILEHGEITPLDAMQNLHCMRLAARISDLKAKGYDIRTKMVRGEDARTGKHTAYASYYLVP